MASSAAARFATIGSAMAGMLLALPARSWACVCEPPPDPSGYDTDVIFVGHVIEVVHERPAPSAAADTKPETISNEREVIEIETPWSRVRFRVQEIVRGLDARELDVWTPTDCGMCGFTFSKGQRYLVFAEKGEDGSLSTSLCSGNARVFWFDRVGPFSEGARRLSYFRGLRRERGRFSASSHRHGNP